MNILYMFGNGLDIQLGLKTRYPDFLDVYLKTANDDSIIKQFKSDIKSDISTWGDVEIALGEYSTKTSNISDFHKIHEDISDCLAEYLKTQETLMSTNIINSNKFMNDITNPLLYLRDIDKKDVEQLIYPQELHEIDKAYNIKNIEPTNIDFVTFNYTNTLETILNKVDRKYYNKFIIGTPLHVHGYIDNRMIFGVNDNSQIMNNQYKNDIILQQAFIKNECNIASGSIIQNDVKTLIKNADVICIFGSSLGKTDNIWWELIGNELIKNVYKSVLIFKYDNSGINKNHRRVYKLNKHINSSKNDILNIFNIPDTDKQSIANRIFIVYNSDFMKNVAQKQQISKAPPPINPFKH